ncbi:hypothetical protein [Streptomyces sp. NPDC002952]|uniref:hypothetical protein n=1 Tax=Streptomyces sp. NPDC002952 TaxID=3364673 RepID=UPI00368EBB60
MQRPPSVYLLFAHEPYYPEHTAREINTTLVVADSLLHRQIRQPDGVRIHQLLTDGRAPGEIVPLATLTHELEGGAGWRRVGDWEGVTRDLLHLARCGHCDAIHFGLPGIDRALISNGPMTQIRMVDRESGDVTVFGPDHRRAVLEYMHQELSIVTADEVAMWPGTPLLSPLPPRGGASPARELG